MVWVREINREKGKERKEKGEMKRGSCTGQRRELCVDLQRTQSQDQDQARVRWREKEGQELHQHNTTRHNTKQIRYVKTRQNKTRHDKARQAKTKNALPQEQDRLKLCTLSTFSLQTFHKRPYSCLSYTDTFTCPVCVLCTKL